MPSPEQSTFGTAVVNGPSASSVDNATHGHQGTADVEVDDDSAQSANPKTEKVVHSDFFNSFGDILPDVDF
ncbi:hypothetical protein AB6A40_002303 [Gnathostoma spinigerum]|uniref:Uncharacterized protein n=1 Tax=Gnathostoma spinigerum TaxID=75299 RepID=A0ABD6EBS4_9BILA